MFWRKRYALMDAAGDAGGGSGGAAAGGDGSAAATAAASGDAGAGGASALAAGANAGGAPSFDWLPEKYRVNGADGALDLNASAQKLAGGYGELSTRMRDGGAPPKEAGEYQVTVPDTLKDVMGDLSQDKTFTDFRAQMHSLGLSQKQFEGVLGHYFQIVPALAAGVAQHTTESATAELRKSWGDDDTFGKNVKLAYGAGSAIAKAGGMSFEDLEKAGLANNPTFIKLMAAIGPEFAEDLPPDAARSDTFSSQDDINKLLVHPGNADPKHPEHKAIRARIDAYYSRKYGSAVVS